MGRAWGVLLLASVAALGAQSVPLHLPPLDRALPPRAEAIYRAVEPRVDRDAAMAIVTPMAPLWRLAGNPQFDQSLESIAAPLTAAGIATRYETITSSSQGWEMRDAVLRLDGPAGEVVLSRAQDRVPLAINSFATPAGGTTAPLVDVGAGTEPRDYEGRTVKGAVVLADGPIGAVWNQAVKARGAAGVISTQIAAYTRPDTTPDVLQWGNIPYAPDRRRSASRRRRAPPAGCASGWRPGRCRSTSPPTRVFHRRPVRTLVAEFPGTRWPDERVVLVAHVQEPGANDNASGCGTLLAAALALQKAIADGALPRPARTLTLLWGDEIRASDAWIAADAGPGRPRAGDDVARHDRRGHGQDRRHLPHREEPRSHRRVGAAVGPAFRVGRQRGRSRDGARQLPERPAPGGGAAPGPRHRLGGAHQPLRGRQRSHLVHQGRRAGAAQLALHRPLLPHQPRHPRQGERGDDGPRRHHRGDDGDVPGVGRPDRRRAARGAAAHRA